MNRISRFLFILAGYFWHLSLFLVLIPLSLVSVGYELDVLLFEHLLGRALYVYPPFTLLVVAAASVFVGVFLISWSYLTLARRGKAFPFAIVAHQQLRAKQLAQSGPYSIVRHPMFLGYVFLLSGAAAVLSSPMTLLWVIPLFSIAYLAFLFFHEERELSRWFGSEYREYQKKVPLFLPKPSLRGRRHE